LGERLLDKQEVVGSIPTSPTIVWSSRPTRPSRFLHSAAHSRGADVVLVDTAGRPHTQVNRMRELEKVRRVIEKQLCGAPHETVGIPIELIGIGEQLEDLRPFEPDVFARASDIFGGDDERA
jgi:signal recognition particle GTPase